MIDYGKVRSTVKPDKVEIDEYSVWLNSDIKEIEISQKIKLIPSMNLIRYATPKTSTLS